MDRREFVRSLALFRDCPQAAVEFIADAFEEEAVADGALLCEEGTLAQHMYVVMSGQVEIVKNYGQSNEKRLAVLSPGDVFGEMSLFVQAARTASAVARCDGVVLKLHASRFAELLERYASDGIRIVKWLLFSMGSRLEQTSRELASIYAVSHLMIEAADPAVGGRFMERVCDEFGRALPASCSVAIYLYNMFNEEFVLAAAAGQPGAEWQPSYEKADDAVLPMLARAPVEVPTAPDRPATLWHPMFHGPTLTGFVVVQAATAGISPGARNLVASIADLLSVFVEYSGKLQDEHERQRLRDLKSRYTM